MLDTQPATTGTTGAPANPHHVTTVPLSSSFSSGLSGAALNNNLSASQLQRRRVQSNQPKSQSEDSLSGMGNVPASGRSDGHDGAYVQQVVSVAQSATPVPLANVHSLEHISSSLTLVDEQETSLSVHQKDTKKLDQVETVELGQLPTPSEQEKARSNSKRLLTFAEIPAYLKDNPDIHTGYRALQYSYAGCWSSLLYLHNETGNILSHGLGALGFVGILFATIGGVGLDLGQQLGKQELPTVDLIILSIFFLGAIVCLSCSALFHLFICHSQDVSKTWNRVDYVGIVALIVTSFFPATYYVFHCHPVLIWVYLSCITAFGGTGIAVSLLDYFNKPAFRVYRTLLFVSMGLSGLIPVMHAVFWYGTSFVRHAMGGDKLILMGALYLLGALIYATRVPERWFPGKFDYWFHSHQLFHLLVVAAATVHYFGMVGAFKWWHEGDRTTCRPGWWVA